MRDVLRYLARPGVFMAVVGILVLAGAGCLWRGMRQPEKTPESDPVAAIILSTQADGDLKRILSDMGDLAFEEELGAPLEDGVKQADFALVQAMLRSNISPDAAAVEKVELRHNDAGAYHFQRIRLTVGDRADSFMEALRESLRAWAEGAEFTPSKGGAEAGASLWAISVAGVVTHELVLTTLPGAAGTGTAAPGRILRRRSPGEAARLVIVMDDLGEDMRAVRTLANLPFAVTFAVWPRSTNAKKAAEAGHAAGREVIIHQPTEPLKYPEVNPGPGALYVSQPDAEIEARVRDSLTRVPFAVGMNNHMGSRFSRDRRGTAAMVRPLKDYGFFVLDSMTHPGSILHGAAKDA
ncbi:divergent polysaccharide deacetylase family protein, partial [Desulfovibrio sp. OttesenSCG-928-O18]|nr:divergent polysaccharide deacetylase family protein [Desulfovibrio sp. OttesenSCG-928-O18]